MSSTIPPWRASASTTTTMKYAPTAYTPVQARRTLVQNNTTTSTQEATEERKRVEWPLPVRQYVQRSFDPENQVASVSRQELERKLKQVITEAAQSESLDTVDWNSLPLPQVMIQNERNSVLTNSLVSSPWSASANVAAMKSGLAHDERSKKRKSNEFQHTDGSDSPPWRKANNRTQLEASYTPTDKRPRVDYNSKSSSKSKASLELRKRRFGDPQSYQDSSRSESPAATVIQGPIVGRCQDLEKRYFRLTSAPNPDVVRPLPILEKTLDFLKKKWRKENNYGYICDQFKSLRQDLTVQHIRNEFTVNVYEIHARIALEKGDLGEYNQCQTQLRALYAQKLGGHPMEFMAYRILYFIYTRNQTAINDALADLTPTDKSDLAVKHALDVRSALALGNYHRFFQLYLDTPNMGAYLMDMFVDRERLSALACICKTYKPDVKIRFITEELGFESDEQSVRFILEYASGELLQERDGHVRLLTGKAGRMFEDAKSQAYRVVDIKGQI
ncbi:SAC3/GANP domain protein [Talaromyces stipitatus ATCC 10500]|uniref:SAC3/GANP domain protein n=1 Tax=Talaromyces stipitatus (strain ATCC 10500 / CBS 375.48 / QM 6759 / NRRL 1006) TaxID=441959 RepID=B8MDR5_TALSN|nr:SAC3/GANP domain protein [Talaromyces stipitatus ATCC 10500]EED18294.1 SAC3/GANP domain protein [Talaromyces stipitatus ATCC 10500]